MQDPAVTEPTTRSGLSFRRLAAFSLLTLGLFLLVGNRSARAEGLLDEVVAPVEQVVETLPVDEVVEAIPVEPVDELVEPTPEPAADEAEPAETQPAPPTAPASESPAGEQALVDEVVSVAADVVTGVAGAVAAEPDQGVHLADPVETVVEVIPTVVPSSPAEVTEGSSSLIETVTKPVADLERALSPVVEEVERVVPVPELTREIAPIVSGIVDLGSETVVSLVDTLEPPLEQVIGTLPPVLERVLNPLPGTLGDTIGGLTETIEDVLPGSPSPDLPDPTVPIAAEPVPDRGSNAPDGVPRTETPMEAADPVESPPPSSPTGIPVVGEGSTRAAADAPSDPTSTAPAQTIATNRRTDLEEGGQPGGDSEDWVRALSFATSAAASSGSGPVTGLLAVLVLTGLAVPRLSRWLRLQPVLWRPNALAVAIERPG